VNAQALLVTTGVTNADTVPLFRRDTAESITSSLEYATTALPHLKTRIPPIRQCWQHLTNDHSIVKLNPEAHTCVRHWYNLFTNLTSLYFPFANLFERPHDIEAFTDASGKHGFGGHAPGLFFCEPLQEDWNLHLDTLPAEDITEFLRLSPDHRKSHRRIVPQQATKALGRTLTHRHDE